MPPSLDTEAVASAKKAEARATHKNARAGCKWTSLGGASVLCLPLFALCLSVRSVTRTIHVQAPLGRGSVALLLVPVRRHQAWLFWLSSFHYISPLRIRRLATRSRVSLSTPVLVL